MELDNDLITRFAKITQFNKDRKDATTVRGVVRTSGEGDNTRTYIQLDGAEDGSKTPAETTVEVSDGDRVIAAVKDHSVIITGNKSNPSIGTKTAGALRSEITQTAEEIRLEVEDTAKGLSSTISQTAGQIRSEVNNSVSGLNSKITQTADAIRSEVSNTASGLNSKIEQTASEINQRIENLNGVDGSEFTEFKQTVEGFYFIDDEGTVFIDGGSIYAKNLELTGAITWSDLSSGVQNDITDAQDTADAAQVVADEAYELAEEALTAAENMNLPGYIKETYIDSTDIMSPRIIGGEIFAVGSDPDENATFSAMTEDGFFLYHNMTKSDVDGEIHPKISLTVGNSGSIFSDGGDKVSIIVGAGEADSSVFRQRLFIEKDPNGAYIHFYNTNNDYCGLSMWYDGEVQAFGKWNFSTADSVTGIGGSGSSGDPLDAWPVGSIMLKYNQTSPASYLGGSWTRISPYFLYAAGSSATIGDTGTVITDVIGAQSVDSAYYIKITAWRRTS
jgi:gas vesicle protein